MALGQRGFVHLAVDYLNQQPTNHAGPDGRFPGDPGFDQVTSHAGRARELQKQAAVNAQYQLGDATTLYGFALFSHRNLTGNGFFRSISQYTNPGALTIFPDGFLPAEQYTTLDGTYVLGVRGLAAGWHYDVSADVGTSHSKSWDTNDLNFSLGATSPTAFYIGTTALQDGVIDIDLSRDFDLGWYAPLTAAWGVAYRHARFTIEPGDPASYAGSGAQAFAGYQPADAGSHSRTNVAEYLDLTTDFSARLSAEFAVRHERYSDFGNTTVWKLSARYAFNPTLALRGTASTGFRAPSLQQEYYSATSDQPDILPDGEEVFLVQRTFPVSDPAAKALGAQPLKPEKSHNYSLGVVLTPHGGPTITLDAYQVTVDDRVVLSGSLAGGAVEAYLTSVGFPFLTGGRFFTNAVDTRTRGVDLVGDWDVPLAATRLHLTGGLNYNKTSIRSIAPNPPQLGLIGLSLPIITASKIGQLTVNSPRTKAFAAAVWDIGRFRLRSQLTRYGEFTQLDNDPADDQTYGARWLLDASVAYTTGAWTFTVGGNNVTNAYPERSNAANDFHGINQYPSISPFGFNGAYWYANVAYRW